MVELRKLIELNDDGAKYPTLKFHCDWAAHPVLTGRTAQTIVRLFDKYEQLIEHVARTKGVLDQKMDTSFMAALGPTLTLTNFRNEFNAYLRSHNLDPSIPNEEANWASFLSYYARVIEDCPLRCVSQGFKYNDEVVLKAVAPALDQR